MELKKTSQNHLTGGSIDKTVNKINISSCCDDLYVTHWCHAAEGDVLLSFFPFWVCCVWLGGGGCWCSMEHDGALHLWEVKGFGELWFVKGGFLPLAGDLRGKLVFFFFFLLWVCVFVEREREREREGRGGEVGGSRAKGEWVWKVMKCACFNWNWWLHVQVYLLWVCQKISIRKLLSGKTLINIATSTLEFNQIIIMVGALMNL